MKSLVTVVVPVYNVATYLPECLDSILAQTYRNLEIIVVDDGSTDSSPEICDKYGELDNRIKIVHQQNGGLSAARNTAIEIATGEYITFVDSDDALNCDMIYYLYTNALKVAADISICQYQMIDEKSDKFGSPNSIKDTCIIGDACDCVRGFFKEKGISASAWGKLYKIDLFSDVRYPVGKYHEDVFTTYKVFAKSKVLIIGHEAYYMYRSRPGSIMALDFQPKHMDAIEGKMEQYEFIKAEIPSLEKIAAADIVYAANTCSMRIAHTRKNYPGYVSQLQKIYREHIMSYLIYSDSSIKAKIYSCLCVISLNVVINVIKKLGKNEF